MSRFVDPVRLWRWFRINIISRRGLASRAAKVASLLAILAVAASGVCVWRRLMVAEQADSQPKTARKAPAGARRTGPAAGSGALQTARNLGKAYYEQGKYPEAAAEFQKVIASGHALATDHMDLGMALIQANNLDGALGELTTAKQMDSQLTAIDYELGILYKRELRYPDAESTFKRVVEADPRDPAAWFNLGTVYSAQRKLPEALEAQQHVLAMGFGRGQNFYVAALFHTFTTLTRLRRPEEAQKVLKLHEQLRDKVPNISLQNPALEGGKYGVILVPAVAPAMAADKTGSAPAAFTDVTARLGIKLEAGGDESSGDRAAARDLAHSLAERFGSSVAVGDYDGDGRPDVYLVVPAGTNRLFHNNGDGTFTDVTEKAGVAGAGGSVSAAFADYDNSGHPSLFVAGASGITLYRNQGDGTFTDQTAPAGLAGKAGEFDTRAVLFDADDDGLLDLVVTAYADLSSPPAQPARALTDGLAGAAHFYRNNGDGTFKDITAEAGLAAAQGRMRNAVFADFNNDGYADLLFVRDDGPPLLYVNQGEDKFVDRTAEAGAALAQAKAVDAQAVDFNHDGNFDLALWSAGGYAVLLNQGKGQFTAVKGLPAVSPPESPLAWRGTVADVDGDGFDDLLNVDNQGKLHFIRNVAGRFEERPLILPADHGGTLESVAAAGLGPPGRLNLLAFTRRGQFAALEKTGAPPHWVEVRLDGYKSNKQGVGTVVELKSGNFYKKVQATGEPLRIFTGDVAKLDVVRVTWPNAIVQNSIDVATDKPLQVRESERLASSCPFLYVWDGHQYRFFTDILGVAPLGELQPDGSRVKPNPQELVRLGADLHEQNGSFRFQVTDEMRETDYVDQLRLIAV
ncbi:MAG TPA: FG-GAP-like repeat-containing protein, partial [Terriglobia bacterium]|nr:FG-GAP-like repeat-containing protein [Terriglobia bacterium]